MIFIKKSRAKNLWRALAMTLVLAIVCDIPAATPQEEEEEKSLGKKFSDFLTETPPPETTPARKKRKQSKSLGDSLKNIFRKPTPTPTPSRKRSRTSGKKKTTPTPSEASPSPTPRVTSEESATSESPPSETPQPRPTPGVTPRVAETSEATPSPSPTATASPSPVAEKKRAPVASISADEISGYADYPPEVRSTLDLALDLTTKNLGYKYGSADPAKGGMDCSGFIYYVLSKSGYKDVPRDAREQYIWVRKAGNFQAVLGNSDDTFEINDLKPGDLLFWSGTYAVDREPPITHTMIYLGREKGSNKRIMVGASDGRTYKGQQKFGVSIFDFKVATRRSSDEKATPVFVGYGRIPGLGATKQ